MDQHILFLINHTWARPWLDYPMAVASSWDFWWPILVVAGVVVLISGGFRGWAMLLAIGLAIGVTDALVVDTMKGLVGRPRPHEAVEGVRTLDLARAKPRLLAVAKPLKEEYSTARILPPRGNSFPSGHAANNFALATVIALFWRRWGWLAFVPAVIVSYSRIYVGSHWPLDVLVSCFIGAGVAFLVVAAMAAVWARFGGKLLPRVHAAHPELLGG